MKKEYQLFNNILGVVVILVYIVFALCSENFHYFAFDEIHACNIAQNFSHIDIIKLMRAEGHTFLWFYIIKPFLSIDGFFPGVIKYINLMFMVFAMTLLWFRSPFNPVLKLLIILTCPFLQLYSTYARPYGLGIFLLFLLVVFYKDKLKHPFLYSVLLFFTANTSLMFTVGAGAFGLLFFYEIVKERNIIKISIVSLIAFATLLMLYVQWHDPIIPSYVTEVDFVTRFKNEISPQIDSSYLLNLVKVLVILVPFVTFLYLKKNIKILFFIFFCWVCLFSIFYFVYPGEIWHYYFIYIYWLIAFWLSFDEQRECDIIKYLYLTIFIAATFYLTFVKTTLLPYERDFYCLTRWDLSTRMVLRLLDENSTLYTCTEYNPWIIPFSKHKNIKHLSGGELVTLDNFIKNYQKIKPFSLFELVKKYPQNSYLLLSDSYLKSATDVEEFNKKYELILNIPSVSKCYKIK